MLKKTFAKIYNNRKAILIIFCNFIFLFTSVNAVLSSPFNDTIIESPFNNKHLICSLKNNKYSFLLTGHIYGFPDRFISPVYPASAFVNALYSNSIFNDSKFLILLGDLYASQDSLRILNLINLFKSTIKIPIFNALGNHDICNDININRKLYNDFFGKTYYSFKYNSEKFIFLDAEIDPCNIEETQLAFLKNELNNLDVDEQIKNVFIFTHKIIWFEKIKSHKEIYNSQAKKSTFRKNIEPLLQTIKKKKIFFIAGDFIGNTTKQPQIPFLYLKDSNNITYIVNCLGNTVNDAILKVDIDKNSKVLFNTVSLTNKPVLPLYKYSENYIKKNLYTLNFKGRLIEIIFNNNDFQIGIVTGLIICISFLFFIKLIKLFRR